LPEQALGSQSCWFSTEAREGASSSDVAVGQRSRALAQARGKIARHRRRRCRSEPQNEKPSREEAIGGLIGMLKRLTKAAKKDKLKRAPFIGIGCPGRIDADGSIEAGAQNLPGNWQSNAFNLPASLHEAIPEIGQHETTILMHNDAVVQGLSEAAFMQDVEAWAAFTIGTGLGNALYSNREQ
jgi:predicted NBD/HSP70 family sugar kinase